MTKATTVEKLKYKIQKAKEIAHARGGDCLSKEYINSASPLIFRCANNHEWEATFYYISSGHWCSECNIHVMTPSKRLEKIEIAKNAAISCGGNLVKFNLNNFKDKFTWKCAQNHTWDATYQNVVYNYSWCPQCNVSFSENICKAYLEYLLEKPFIKSRPVWLKSNKNCLMELDGYCHELGLAFEHQGLQHYQNITGFNTTYHEVKERDRLKLELCIKNNVNIIYIPALLYKTPLEELHTLIGFELNRFNIYYNKEKLKPAKDVLDLRGVRTINFKEELDKIKNIAINKGGECLSDTYSGNNGIIKLKCYKDHIWETKAYNIKYGRWCSTCSHESEITIEKVRDFCKIINIECISNIYKNNSIHMDFCCLNCNHKFKSTYNSLQYKMACPKCARNTAANNRKKDISLYQEAAKNKGGQCLSETINSCYDKLEWECSDGHKWFARADQIKNTKEWCPVCNDIRIPIEEYIKIAESKGGKIITKTIKNCTTKIECECSLGHKWTTTASAIKCGHWCKECFSNTVRTDIKVYQQIAESKGGKCLSTEIKRSSDIINLECSQGHKWNTKAFNIKTNKTWCPECYKNNRSNNKK